jgi:signal transduction histidine kinase
MVATEIPRERCADLGGIAPGNYVCVSVNDTGHGMDPATLRRIFDPFFTTKSAVDGVGLGLFVAEGLVRSAGGRLTLDQSQNDGATFVIELPAASPESALPPDTARVATA